MKIIVRSEDSLREVANGDLNPDAILSVGDHDHWTWPLEGYLTTHAVVKIDDVSVPNGLPSDPSRINVRRIISFLDEFILDEKVETLLIHCLAGYSRSPATAFIGHCMMLGYGKEHEAMKETVESCELGDDICPNDLIVAIADSLLGRDGQMINALRGKNEDRGIFIAR